VSVTERMKSYFVWLAWPALLGLIGGALLGTRPAHACSCTSGPFWVLGEPQVQSTDPNADAARFWGRTGHLYPDSLDLWDSEERPAFNRIDYAP